MDRLAYDTMVTTTVALADNNIDVADVVDHCSRCKIGLL